MSALASRRSAIMGLCALAMSPKSAWADASAMRRRINIAGRQRMLTQRMVMAACFIRLEIAEEDHFEILASANDLFGGSLEALRDGDLASDLPPSREPKVLAALDAVDAAWTRLEPVARDIVGRRSVTKNDIGALAVVEDDARALSDNVVKALEAAADGGAANAAVNICGRQRMLTQKMAKEAAMIGLSYRRAENQRNLGGTIELFEKSLTGLIEGDWTNNLKPAPPAAVAPLEQGRERWRNLRPAFEDMVAQGRADLFDLEIIAEERDSLLFDMQSAVAALEAA